MHAQIAKLWQQTTGQGVRVRSQALAPAIWLASICGAIGGPMVLWGKTREVQVFGGIVIAFGLVLFAAAYVWFAIKDPDRLGSETFEFCERPREEEGWTDATIALWKAWQKVRAEGGEVSFKEMLDGKLIEETGGHFDESDMAMYRAGAKAALELAAEECDQEAAWAHGEIPKARSARDLTTENMRHAEEHINTHLAKKLRARAREIGEAS